MPSLNTKLATAPNTTANYVLKATTSTTIGNSLIFDNGNIGINTSTPSSFSGYTNFTLKGGGFGSNLDFHNASNTRIASIVSTSATDFKFEVLEAVPLIFNVNSAERMRITSTGNVGIGTSSVTVSQIGLGLQMGDGTNNVGFRYNVGSGGWGYTEYYQGSTAKWIAGYRDADGTYNIKPGNSLGGSTGLVIESTGRTNVYSSQTYCLNVYHQTNASGTGAFVTALGSNANNTSSYHYIATTGGADKMYVFGNGNIVNVNNSYGPLSDIKLKENIVDATPKLDKLMQVRIVNYNLKGDDLKQIGVIAQELEEVFPGLVDEHTDRDAEGNMLETTTKSVKMSVFVPMLIKAMQEQQGLISELSSKVSALEAK